MSVKMNCPECKIEINLPDNARGKKARCNTCSAVFAIPPATNVTELALIRFCPACGNSWQTGKSICSCGWDANTDQVTQVPPSPAPADELELQSPHQAPELPQSAMMPANSPRIENKSKPGIFSALGLRAIKLVGSAVLGIAVFVAVFVVACALIFKSGWGERRSDEIWRTRQKEENEKIAVIDTQRQQAEQFQSELRKKIISSLADSMHRLSDANITDAQAQLICSAVAQKYGDKAPGIITSIAIAASRPDNRYLAGAIIHADRKFLKT